MVCTNTSGGQPDTVRIHWGFVTADCNFAGQQAEQDLVQGATQGCTYLMLGEDMRFVKE